MRKKTKYINRDRFPCMRISKLEPSAAFPAE
jgi:hypothetical protein